MTSVVSYLFVKKLGSDKLRSAARVIAAGSLLGVISSLGQADQNGRDKAPRDLATHVEPEQPPALADLEPPAAPAEERPHSSSPLSTHVPKVPSAQELVAAERKHQVTAALADARKLVGDKDLCDTPLAIKNVWTVLQTLTHADPEYAAAKALTPKIERCRLQVEKNLNNGLMAVMQQQRIGIRSTLDQHFLDNGLDVRVSVSGRNKDQITLSNIMFGNRAVVHRMTKDGGILPSLQTVGFKRVTFSDGFGDSRYYELKPDREDTVGRKVLTDMGIGEPLKL